MKYSSKIDQIAGTIKENTGKLVGSEELELKGKIQRKFGEMKETMSDLGDDLKEKASNVANDMIDKYEKKK